MFDSLNFIQINLQHSRAATETVMGLVNQHKIEVMLLQDFYHQNNKVHAVPSSGWQVFTSANLTAAIIVTNRNLQVVLSYRDANSVFINVTTAQGCLTIGSIYSMPRSNLLEDMNWLDIFSPLHNIIVGADLNAKLALLGYNREDERGRLLTYLILSNKLTLINDIEAPSTFIGEIDRPCSSSPDVTLCTEDISSNITSWYVNLINQSMSDHRYIRFSLNLKPEILTLNRFKTKFTTFKKFNKIFGNLQSDLMERLEKVTNITQMDIWLENFNSVITETCQKTLKIKKCKLYPTFKWWNDSLKIQRNKIAALYKRFKKSGDPKWKIAVKRERAIYKKQIKQTKLSSWQSFCTSTSDKFGQAFKIAHSKNLKNQHFIHTILQNSTPYHTKSDIFKQLIDHHFPAPEISIPHLLDPATEEADSFSPPPLISFKEIKAAFNEQNNLKAPGFDKFDAFLLKNLNKHFKYLIRNLLNKCLSLNYFPKIWKIAQVIFFTKLNKDPNLPTSYRPICLLPMLGKIYERILKFRINYYLENNNFFHNSQYGFREGRNTLQLLNKIKYKINKYLQTNKYCALISFDIIGAFDNINWDVLANTIHDSPLPRYLKLILLSFITDRKIITDYLHNSETRNISKGCPQGSCLGPLLWLLIANVILKLFYQKYTNLYTFCDDHNMIIKANSRSQLEQIVNL